MGCSVTHPKVKNRVNLFWVLPGIAEDATAGGMVLLAAALQTNAGLATSYGLQAASCSLRPVAAYAALYSYRRSCSRARMSAWVRLCTSSLS
jgi:hypothetical protein